MKVGADGTQSGWYSDNGADLTKMINPHAVDWRTTDFKAGDIVVLGEAQYSIQNPHNVFHYLLPTLLLCTRKLPNCH